MSVVVEQALGLESTQDVVNQRNLRRILSAVNQHRGLLYEINVVNGVAYVLTHDLGRTPVECYIAYTDEYAQLKISAATTTSITFTVNATVTGLRIRIR